MKKATALMLSLFALAYVGLAYADENEDSSQGEQKENREMVKKQWEQKREIVKAGWEKEKEEWKTKREDALEKWKQEKEKLRSEFKEKFTAERCARIQKRVEERTSHFDEREGKHKKVYENLVNRINKFITRFETAGLDTANLKSYLVALQGKIEQFSNDYDAYIAKLKASKSLTCGHAEGEFRGTLVEAKALLKVVHEDAAGIRTYVRTTILPEIKALKDKMPKEDDKADEGGSAN